MFYQYCRWDKAISFLDLQQVPWCFTSSYEELHPHNTKIQATPNESCIAARPSSDTSNFCLFIWTRLFLLTHWLQDIYFKFKIHFLTLGGDLLCSTMENASIFWSLEKITRSIIMLLQRIWSWIEEMVKMTILIHVNWNKVKTKEDEQDLHHTVQNTNQISMLLALPEAQEVHN